MGKEDEIRLIAFNIWQEENCIDGHDCEHWFRAETIWEQKQKENTASKSSRLEPTPLKQTNKAATPKKSHK